MTIDHLSRIDSLCEYEQALLSNIQQNYSADTIL